MPRRALNWILPEENPAGVVFGVITIGAVLAAESGQHETYVDALGSGLVTIVLYWLAHTYSDLLGRRLRTHEHLTARSLARAFAHDWAIVRGAALPFLALAICYVTDAGQETGVTAAVWTCVVSLIAFELLAGIRARSTRSELVLEGLVGTVMGLAILALRAILH